VVTNVHLGIVAPSGLMNLEGAGALVRNSSGEYSSPCESPAIHRILKPGYSVLSAYLVPATSSTVLARTNGTEEEQNLTHLPAIRPVNHESASAPMVFFGHHPEPLDHPDPPLRLKYLDHVKLVLAQCRIQSGDPVLTW